MALDNCRECAREVSTEAATCPNCGVGNPTGSRKAAASGKQQTDSRTIAKGVSAGIFTCVVAPFALLAMVVLIYMLLYYS